MFPISSNAFSKSLSKLSSSFVRSDISSNLSKLFLIWEKTLCTKLPQAATNSSLFLLIISDSLISESDCSGSADASAYLKASGFHSSKYSSRVFPTPLLADAFSPLTSMY